MNVQNHSERRLEIGGWEVNLRTYQIGDLYHCKADNVSPGATIARGSGSTREEAEQKTIAKAAERLALTKRHPV
jgi:hypothetical protein